MKSSISHLVLVSIAAVAVFVGYGIFYAFIAEKSASVAVLETTLQEKADIASRIASARTALSEIAGDEKLIQSYFVADSGVVSFIEELQERARAQGAGVSVLSVSAGNTNTHPTLTLVLQVRGTFEAVVRTIGAIEYAPYNISLSNLSLQQDVKNGWYADFSIVVGSLVNPVSIQKP